MAVVVHLGESMSSRAKVFLIVAICHFAIIGSTILLWPEMYAASSWVALVEYTHLAPWGVAHLIVSGLCLVAVFTRWPNYARAGLVLAFVVLMVTTVAVAWGVIVSWIAWHHGLTERPASPFVPVACLALAIKDLLMVSAPLRTPFEDSTPGDSPPTAIEVA